MKFLEKRVFSINIRYWFIYIFDIETTKNTFSIKKIYFYKNFYFNKFIYLFLLQNLTLLISKPPTWKDGSFRWKDRWLLPLFSFYHRVSYLWLTALLLRSRWFSKVTSYIYVFGPIFVKLANDFNPSCLSPTFVKKNVFPMEHMKLKWPSIKLV